MSSRNCMRLLKMSGYRQIAVIVITIVIITIVR